MVLRAAVLAAAFVSLVAFSVVLAKVTLTPSPASEDLVTSNLRPGRSLRQYAEDYTFLAACKQAGGNLLLGAPFGVLLPILVPRRLRMLRMTVLTVLVIAVIELVQGSLVAGRAFDIDDVILNTSGALIGYLLLGRRVSHHYHALAAPPAAQADKTGAGKKAAQDKGTAKPDAAAASGSKAKPKTAPAAGTKKSLGAAGAGTKTKAAPRSGTGTRSGSKGKTPAGSAARAGASAPVARGRALVDRLRSRGQGPGEGAPGPRRRGA